jgi:protein TonB
MPEAENEGRIFAGFARGRDGRVERAGPGAYCAYPPYPAPGTIASHMSVSTSTARIFDDASGNRMLRRCVAASIVLHSAVLWLVPGARQAAPAAVTVLTATFAPRAAPEAAERLEPRVQPQAAPRPPEPVRPPPAVKPEVKPPEPPRAAPARPTPDAIGPRIAQEPPAPTASAAPAQSASAAPSTATAAAAAAPRAQEAPSAPAEPAARAGDSADAGNLDQYRLALIGVARKYKRYPAQAMEKGWTGRVEVRLIIAPNGMIQSALVKSSSGYDILDNQALDMVKKAKPLTPIPPALRGREFTVDVPVIFDLQTG